MWNNFTELGNFTNKKIEYKKDDKRIKQIE